MDASLPRDLNHNLPPSMSPVHPLKSALEFVERPYAIHHRLCLALLNQPRDLRQLTPIRRHDEEQ
ncbi:MAG: hypothetical protein Q9211_006834, partial [Gyalolechia sp. 1 TL-2023]